jgi:hypothetical protein
MSAILVEKKVDRGSRGGSCHERVERAENREQRMREESGEQKAEDAGGKQKRERERTERTSSQGANEIA